MISDERVQQLKLQAERRTGLGGSHIAAMYSIGYGCARALQYDRRGTPEDYPKEETAEMERGRLLEPIALEVYKLRTGRSAKPDGSLYRHPDHPWMVVRPDGWTGKQGAEIGGVLEFKVLGQWSFRRQKRQGLEEAYILQMQHAMCVLDAKGGSVGILCLEPWQFIWFDVERNEEFIRRLIEDEAEFWSKVQNGPWVEKLNPKDPRCGKCPWRRTCQGEILFEAPPQDERLELPRDESLLEKVRELDQRKQLKKEAEELEEEASTELKALLGDRPGAVMSGYRVYYREHPEERWDTSALNAKCKTDPLFKSLVGRYKKPGTKRPLRLYATGD